MTLTISTPKTSYPPDALVPVTVTLRNRSNRNAAIEECGGFLPRVEMLDAKTHLVRQPAVPTGVVHPACFDPAAPSAFPVGDLAEWQEPMILRASRLRALTTILKVGDPWTAAGTNLQTPILRLHVLPPSRTRATIVPSPYLHATVQAPAGARVYYTDRVDCTNPYTGASFEGTSGWTLATSHTILPSSVASCTHRTRWQIAVAAEGMAPVWLDHRVPLPPLPTGAGITAPQCRSMPPHGVGAIADTWHGAVYLVAANGARTCRLTGNVGANDARLAPDGRWVTWHAPDRAHHAIYDPWLGRADGRAIWRLPTTAPGSPSSAEIWSPDSKQFAYGRGNSIFVVFVGSRRQVRLAAPGNPVSPPLSWLPNGSAVLTQTGPQGMWAHEIDLSLNGVAGQVGSATVQFPSWLSNPNARPIGSRILTAAFIGADGRHVFLPTSGGGVRLSGVWEAGLHSQSGGSPARLVIGTRARVQGRRAPAAHLSGATHMFGSPDGRYLAVDPTAGFWVEDTRTLQGRLLRAPAQPNCVISQSSWMSGGNAIAFVQTCKLAGGTGFRSTLWSVALAGGAPRRLLSAIDYGPDAISIDTVYRCVGCGYAPGS